MRRHLSKTFLKENPNAPPRLPKSRAIALALAKQELASPVNCSTAKFDNLFHPGEVKFMLWHQLAVPRPEKGGQFSLAPKQLANRRPLFHTSTTCKSFLYFTYLLALRLRLRLLLRLLEALEEYERPLHHALNLASCSCVILPRGGGMTVTNLQQTVSRTKS